MTDTLVTTIAELVDAGIIERPIDGNHGEIHPKASDFTDYGIPFLMASDLRDGRVDLLNCKFISADLASSLRKGFAKAGDVLLSHKATIGRTAIVQPNKHPFVMLTPQITYYRVIDIGKLSPVYLRYYFESREFQQILAAWAGAGSTRAYLGITAQLKLPIKLPPIEVQNSIAAIASPLDRRIELNRQMNETLEAMARAIFKDWFVDFGPTRAKMEGRASYLAPDIWSLFPDRLDEEGRPEGWQPEILYEQSNWVNGAAYKDMHFSEAAGALPVVKIAELKAGIGINTMRTNTDLGDRYKIYDGELLFSWSGNPDTSIDAFIWTSGPAWLNQHIFAVRPNGKLTKAALYIMLKTYLPEFAEIARNKQTTGLGHVTKADMQRMSVNLGSDNVRAAFEEVVGPLVDRVMANLFESQTLAATRDLLLPKLMSGEIRVRDAEKLIEEVA
ncbi:restriction endonuclease subunit S [Xanthobacter aminoxidans]|uniref:restriction endonuclease subunit S n=1 Tax=Xanthobacter aminoxidans TaxID=186280 RepID=UPI0037276354